MDVLREWDENPIGAARSIIQVPASRQQRCRERREEEEAVEEEVEAEEEVEKEERPEVVFRDDCTYASREVLWPLHDIVSQRSFSENLLKGLMPPTEFHKKAGVTGYQGVNSERPRRLPFHGRYSCQQRH